MNQSVFVSGASGFIASHIVELLLGAGHRVRGSIRRKGENIEQLTSLPGADRLELVEADLLAPSAFHPHVKGYDCVLHTASPYTLHAKDAQRDLVEPAVRGTRSMLEACAESPSISAWCSPPPWRPSPTSRTAIACSRRPTGTRNRA